MVTKSKIIKWLDRIQWAVDRIPPGHSGIGTKTISVSGVVGFQNDMIEFRKLFRDFVWAAKDDDSNEAERQVEAIETLASQYIIK